jgi:hypothetical protein
MVKASLDQSTEEPISLREGQREGLGRHVDM